MEKVNISIYKGQTYQRNLIISGLELEITQMYLTVKENTNSKHFVLQKKIGSGITLMDVDDDGNYIYIIEISSEDTENLKTDYEYGYDITIKSGNMKEPIVMGTFKVEGVYTTKRDET